MCAGTGQTRRMPQHEQLDDKLDDDKHINNSDRPSRHEQLDDTLDDNQHDFEHIHSDHNHIDERSTSTSTSSSNDESITCTSSSLTIEHITNKKHHNQQQSTSIHDEHNPLDDQLHDKLHMTTHHIALCFFSLDRPLRKTFLTCLKQSCVQEGSCTAEKMPATSICS